MKYEGGRNMLSVFFELLKMAWGLKDPKKSTRIKVIPKKKKKVLYVVFYNISLTMPTNQSQKPNMNHSALWFI